MAKRRIVLSSVEEQKIENAYVQTKSGKAMFTLTLVACVALLVGLLIETYKISAANTEFLNPDSLLYVYSNQLFMWGSFVALVCLTFYIKFAIDFKAKKGKTRTTKKETETKTKTTKKVATAKKTATKPADKKKTTKK